MASFFIGLGDVAGNELLDVTAVVTGAFVRPVVTDRVITSTAFLEWFAETPTGGGEFGEPPPNNARIRATSVLTGGFVTGYKIGLGDGVDAELIESTVQVTGVIQPNAIIDNNVIEATVEFEGRTGIDVSFGGIITAVSVFEGVVAGELPPTLPEDILAIVQGGMRPCFPLIVYLDNVSHEGNLQTTTGAYRVELHQAFRMSPDFIPIVGEALTVAGALPGYIGMRVSTVIDDVAVDGILFRPPYDNEQVIVAATQSLEKWNAAAQTWVVYRTLPQRALDGMRLFEVFDPTGIINYYGKVLGLKYAALMRDTNLILDFIDPQRVPSDFVPLLADNFGAPVEADQNIDQARETVRTWVPLMQLSGTPQAIVIALKNLGFAGFATHIWIRETGATAENYIEVPFGDTNATPPVDGYIPSSSIAIHLANLDGSILVVIDNDTKQRVAAYLKQYVLPAHVQIRTFVLGTRIETSDSVTLDDGNTASSTLDVTATIVVTASPATVTADVEYIQGIAAVVQPSQALISVSVTITPP